MPRHTSSSRPTPNATYNFPAYGQQQSFQTLSRASLQAQQAELNTQQHQSPAYGSTTHSLSGAFGGLPHPDNREASDDDNMDYETSRPDSPAGDANGVMQEIFAQHSLTTNEEDAIADESLPDIDIGLSEDPDLHDDSEPVEHTIKQAPGDFELALAIWTEKANISREKYKALLSVLALIRNVDEINNLPATVDTLKGSLRTSVPLLPMRRKELQLDARQIPGRMSTKGCIYTFDLPSLVTNFLQSQDICSRIHFGMAHLVDEPSELWQSHAWGSSVRTTSGEFARYADDTPLLPSDVVYYHCTVDNCPCQPDDLIENETEQSIRERPEHIGRVSWTGIDHRSGSPRQGDHVVKINPLITKQKLVSDGTISADDPDLHPSNIEVLLRTDQDDVVWADMVHRRISIYCDLDYGTAAQDDTSIPQRALVLRRVVQQFPFPQILPYNLIGPPRAEGEIEPLGRAKTIEKYCRADAVSLPVSIFIDQFGLYKNMYRAMMGIYMTFLGFGLLDRNRDANTIPITLGPHAAAFEDVIHSLPGLRTLDAGMFSDALQKFLCMPILFFTGDMPQQQSNAGCKGPRATRACRSCLILDKERGDVDYNFRKYTRTHHNVKAARTEAAMRQSLAVRTTMLSKAGLSLEEPVLKFVAPTLDMLVNTPPDPAHSEYKGLGKLAASLLISVILTKDAQSEFAHELSKHPMPIGWGRLQNPLSHLGSYGLQEFARLSVIIPLLLRCWLVEDHITVSYANAMRTKQAESMRTTGHRVEDEIVKAYAEIARSNAAILSRTTQSQAIHTAVVAGRKAFARLVRCAISTMGGTRRGSRMSALQSREPSPVPSLAQSDTTHGSNVGSVLDGLGLIGNPTTSKGKKGKELEAFLTRPNFHIALHFQDTVKEFASMRNVHVLVGESKHKKFKHLITKSNHKDVELFLLRAENIDQTLRLLLGGSYDNSYPDIAAKVKRLYQHCPRLFYNVLPKLEQLLLTEEEPHEFINGTEPLAEDADHTKVLLHHRLKNSERDALQLPKTAAHSHMPILFRTSLEACYKRDYNIRDVWLTGTAGLTYWRQLSFFEPQFERRRTLRMGNVVGTTASDDLRYAIILSMFTQILGDTPRLFFQLQMLEYIPGYGGADLIVFQRYYQKTSTEMIVGLSKITLAPWMFEVKQTEDGLRRGESDMMLACDWDLTFM